MLGKQLLNCYEAGGRCDLFLVFKIIPVIEKFYRDTICQLISYISKSYFTICSGKNSFCKENRLQTQSQLIPFCQTVARFWSFISGHANAKFRRANCPAWELSDRLALLHWRRATLSGLGTSVLKTKPQVTCLWEGSNRQDVGFDPIESRCLGPLWSAHIPTLL